MSAPTNSAQGTGTSTAHTPGPWEAHGRTVYAGCGIIALGVSEYDAERGPTYHEQVDHLKSDDEGTANAALIARAPDLLAEVTALRATLNDAVELCETLRTDRDALAKQVQVLRHCLQQCVQLLDANALGLCPDGGENKHPIINRARAALERSAP